MSSWSDYFYATAQSLGSRLVSWLDSNNIEVRIEYNEDGVRYRRIISGPNRHEDYVIERMSPLEAATALIATSSTPAVGGRMTDSMIDSQCLVMQQALSSSSIEQCPICMDNYQTGDYIRVLPCFHKYHKSCIDEWLRPHGDCPVCKYSLVNS